MQEIAEVTVSCCVSEHFKTKTQSKLEPKLSQKRLLDPERPEPRSHPSRCPALHLTEIEGYVQGSAEFTIIAYMIMCVCWKSQLHSGFSGHTGRKYWGSTFYVGKCYVIYHE